MDWPAPNPWAPMQSYLQSLPQFLPEKPKAILVISAHWEDAVVAVQTKPDPKLYFDYYGFPDHTYRLTWPAPLATDVAQKTLKLLHDNGIASRADAQRDFDHGVFIPLKVAFPEADIPTFQLSLLSSLDPKAHWDLGRVLKSLRDEGVLIIGSGLSFHNLRAFFAAGSPQVSEASRAFDAWLYDSVSHAPETLLSWQNAPHARFCHPREEHLLPLMVCAGAGLGLPVTRPYHETDFGPSRLSVSAFHWQ